MTLRERRRTDEPEAPAVVPAQPAPPTPAARLLRLQRGAGNAAVTSLLQRKGTQPPRAGGWNEGPQEVAGTLRIPVSGVKAGYQEEDPQLGQTQEAAAGRAVVHIPRALDVSGKVDTLLFFHGMWNAGYRERTADDADKGKAGTVHDVEADRIPQQMHAAGDKLVAVLPQGGNRANFFIADPAAYVQEVLKLATPAYQAQMQKPDAKVEPGRIIVAGHSGGGRAAMASEKKLDKTGTEAEWLASPPLMLFDGINGTLELDGVVAWVKRSLEADKRILDAAADPLALLAKRRLKLFSTFTAGGRYAALNNEGHYVDDSGADVDISPARGLRGQIRTWFATRKPSSAYADKLREQYAVEGPVAGKHEQTVGTGASPEKAKEKRLPAPSGLTGASKAAGVPDYKGGGHLEQGLKKLYPKRRLARDPDAAAAQLEADWNDPAYASSKGKFKGSGRPTGTDKERYLKLAPLYKARGIDRPLKWAHENITSVTFFGSTTPAHVDLKTALEAAEADLRSQGITKKPFASCWAFNPRTTTKGGWSNHADGRAIDIDADTNPHLLDLRQKKIINAVTGMDVTAENPGAAMGKTAYEAIAEMSKRFQDRWSPEGLEERIAELEADERALAAEEAAIDTEIKAVPKRKRGRLTPDERKAAAENEAKVKQLTAALKAKHAQVAKAQERQDLLGKEAARFEKTDTAANVQRWKIAELGNEIYDIEKEIDKLEAEIEAAEKALDEAEAAAKGKTLTKDEKKAKTAADRATRAEIRKDRARIAKLGKQRKANHKAIAEAEGKIDTLHRWGQEGFMDLKPQLVSALQKAGLSWGGEWAGSKDFMHFEVKP